MRLLVMVPAVVAVLFALEANAQQTDESWQTGRAIYYTAMRPDGTSVRATVQQDVQLPPGVGACVSCHRRSGLGVAEDGSRALNITAASLFQPSAVPPLRPAYDEALLTRAIVAGIAANGEPLSSLMPRYQLTADDAKAVTTYLRSLGAAPDPGVTDTELMIATIITPDSPDRERQALESIIPEYVRVKNAGTRQEQRRAVASARHAYGLKRYQAYREWKHAFWKLEGSPKSWRKQLESYYAENPAFAILSGSFGEHADIVHNFCEENQIACILPMTNFPPPGESGFYSLYFSSGAQLEAEVIAKHFMDNNVPGNRRILLVHNDDEASVNAKRIVLQRLAGLGSLDVKTHRIKTGKVLSAGQWQRLLKNSSADSLVMLVPGLQMRNLLSSKIDGRMLPARILTTESFIDWSHYPDAVAIADRILHVYPFSLPTPGQAQFPREQIWLRSRGIESPDSVEAAKVLFACKALGMALADIQSNHSREYLLESLEHALDNSFLTSLYPRTSLGPDQRYLSRGAYLARLAYVDGKFGVASGTWMHP